MFVKLSPARETSLKISLRAELKEGMAAARDPINADLPPLALRTTTIYSPWYTRTCPECRDKFREGDRVRQCPDCRQAYHDDDQYGLYCWQQRFAGGRWCRIERHDPIDGGRVPGCDFAWSGTLPDATRGSVESTDRLRTLTGQVLQGMETVWKVFGEASVSQVEPESPIIKHKCPWCRFLIRVGDRVVKCPCGQCDTYFHDDLFRHLTCWNDWNGTRGNNYCPTTGALIEGRFRPVGDDGVERP